MKRVILYIIILINLTACSIKEEFVLFNQSPSIQDGSRAENLNRTMETTYIDSAKFEYKIRPHDRVSIITYKRPELSTNNGTLGTDGGLGQGLLVNSNGIIRLPLIDDVKIAGLTQPEAQHRLESRFREYLRHPSIQVEVVNKRAFILGEVNNPGPIELRNEQIPLLQLLSVAGDLTRGANRQSIMILKNYGDSVQTKIISLTDANSIATANQMIRPNDIVYVVPKGMAVFNSKVGEINPIFQLITNALTPFLTIRLLSQ
ncbi:polysaccharide export protein [Sulfurovum sp. bin170]|uniref:polysaccharide biosynthesis/export family protein n=1 Tax=Sulfurovum sp. bin170 TaxID=2695268 RepID=UPI0013DEDFB8|nr:polysaccharide biosynthesis/export family protein [Sulfurovum sp. bin170]NEW60633.1 polysaccharide export protein [Sulfurovum sp. bin170]